MPPLTLEGDTLGEKHRRFNKLVEDAIADKHHELCNIKTDDSDIDNLLKINIASKTRNVDYIIEVMKSNDLLYAATAIKKSTWLITEQQYAHIINPEYLHTQLLHSMNPKSFNKLMLHIRLNLKDETRVEAFYEYLKETDSAYKWLQNCSIPFIENVIKNERLIPLSLFKRLCKRSANFITLNKRVIEHNDYEFKRGLLFLLKSHTQVYLNFLDEHENLYMGNIGKKRSEILMKTCSHRIFKKFEKFADVVDPSIAAKYLKKEEIKPFLFKQIKKQQQYFTEYENLKHFVKNMPEEEKQEFIRQTFIDRTDLTFLLSEDEQDFYKIDLQSYHWYEYVPFNVAFPNLKKLILAENSPTERIGMLSILIKCARKNLQHIKTLLQFVKDRHINEPYKFKIQFINNLLSQIPTHEFDLEIWNILDQLFHSMEVYTESEKNVQLCLQAIVLYKVLHDEPVPEIIEQKMEIDHFHRNQKILDQKQNDKIFAYLLNTLLKKIRSSNVTSKSEFDVNSQHLINVLNLLKDWKKEISCFPFVLQKIQELVNNKLQNSWKIDPEIYNIKTSWRKYMFEESLSLSLCEETCLNALKHKPQLLMQHDKEVDTLRTNDAVSLRRLLTKLRIYWPDTLAKHWTDAYLHNLNKTTGQKAITRGLFVLLPQNEIINFAKKHAPSNFKINWGETDQTEINIQKNIAENLHVGRPLIPIDTVLWYANGDYLQYAVPSLNAIFSKWSTAELHKYVLKLLEAPISLQKLGLRLAISSLKPSSELKICILNIWKSTSNSIIRAVIFNNTYHQMCKVKNLTVEKELWTLLSMYFDTLTSRENKEILKCLGKVEKVPNIVRAEFYMKSYAYLTSLPENDTRNRLMEDLVAYARDNLDILESFNDDFVTDKLLSPAGTKFCKRDGDFINIFGHYVLWAKSEEDQLQRFRRVIEPAMEEAFLSWNKAYLDDYYVRINFSNFTRFLITNIKDYIWRRKSSPAKLFTEIKNKMEKNLPLLENYITYTSWKLVTEHVKLMEQHISEIGNASMTDDKEILWNEIHVAMYPALALQIVKCLKQDTEQYFPSICFLFEEAFLKAFDELFDYESEYELEILKRMLYDPDFIPSYMVVSRATVKYFDIPNSSKRIRKEIREKIESHPSQEVQMHYFNDFELSPPDEIEE
ncbi:hypothetical protein PYW08_008264 [Mythimna loreyi]|uniref:Uncharacterized protein n=1 Tax=Mythimna loreyi TaxID=667449 RepID=A0ACC2QCS4_9NEOP|nr:hypothetical protein PYW08_008264 [Mythimna loreyi]